MEDQEPSKVETIVKVCVLLWSATLLSLSYYEPPSGKKIVDFDPTFIASIFSASTASLGFQIKKKKDTIVDNKFVTSAQITVDMPYVVTNKVGTTYSLSGNNITPSVTVGDTTTSGKIGGINVGSLTEGVPAMIQTDTSVTTAGSAFSKTESVIMGDATPSTVTPSSGIAALPVLGGQTTIGSGGTAGSLALTSLSSGIHTCTAGGSGTSCIGSTKVTITID